MVTDLQSTLDAIDTLAVHQCGQCDQPLPEGSVSAYWCDGVCQEAWNAARSEALVGYREPEDLPVHYSHSEDPCGFTNLDGSALRHFCPGLPLSDAREVATSPPVQHYGSGYSSRVVLSGGADTDGDTLIFVGFSAEPVRWISAHVYDEALSAQLQAEEIE